MGKRESSSSGFEMFQAHKRSQRLRGDEVSLGKASILLSEKLAKRLGEAKWVVLLYNRDQHAIGIRPAAPNEDGYKISYRSISSRSFFQHFQIQERGRFKARVDPFGMLIADLRQKTDAVEDRDNPPNEA